MYGSSSDSMDVGLKGPCIPRFGHVHIAIYIYIYIYVYRYIYIYLYVCVWVQIKMKCLIPVAFRLCMHK